MIARTVPRTSSSLIACALLFATVLLAACDVRLPLTGTSTAPHRGGSIVNAFGFDPRSLLPAQLSDPVEATVAQAIWAPLWYGDPTGAFHPGLAREVPSVENGDVSADLKTWTIHLKPNLKWSDGSPLSADDLAFSLNTFADPHFANTNGFPLHDPADPIDFLGASVLDTTTVRFTLAHPDVAMDALLADGDQSIIPRAVFGGMAPGDIPKSPENVIPTVSSGPFKVVDHVQADHITVVRNPYYYQGPDEPYLDQITFKIFPSIQAVLDAAQAGQIDTAFGGGTPISAAQLGDLHGIPGYTPYIEPHPPGFEVLVFNLSNAILGDKVVRQALALSLDPKQIIAKAAPGIAVPTCDDHAGTFAHEPNLTCYPQNPERARQLLEEDGWVLGDDGFRHKGSQTLELNYSTARLPSHLLRASVGPFAQAAWAQIGVKLDVHIYPADFFGPGGPADDAWEIAEYATGTGYDPDDRYSFMCDLSGMHYCNPTVDQAEMTQESTTDQATRLAAFKTIHRAILDDLPVMYLYSEASVGLYRSTLHNYQPFDTGGDTWNCWEWYLDQG